MRVRSRPSPRSACVRTFGLYEPKEQIDWESFEGRNVHWQVVGHRMFLVLLPLSVIGAVLLGRSRRPWWPLVAPVAVVVLTSAISYGNQRFRILAEPGILILRAVTVVAGGQWIVARVRARDVQLAGGPSLHCWAPHPESTLLRV